MARAKKHAGGRPKKWEQHKGYSYTNKHGKTVHVKAHRESYK